MILLEKLEKQQNLFPLSEYMFPKCFAQILWKIKSFKEKEKKKVKILGKKIFLYCLVSTEEVIFPRLYKIKESVCNKS